MGTVIGFVVGYVFGTRVGEEGYSELRNSWDYISHSDEVREMVESVASIGRDLLSRGRSSLADRIEPRLRAA